MCRTQERITSRRRPARVGGFTVVELIAVVAVLGVVSTVCLTSLASLSSSRGGAAARRLMHDLSYAREIALSTGSRTWVSFNTAGQTYSLFAESVAAPGLNNSKELEDPATGFAYVQRLNVDEFVGVQLTSVSIDGGFYLGFDWMGAPLNSTESALVANAVLSLSSGHTITIQTQSGMITVVPEP